MVRRVEDGVVWHEPPYTEEEENELYRRMAAGPITVLRGPREPQPPVSLPKKSEK